MSRQKVDTLMHRHDKADNNRWDQEHDAFDAEEVDRNRKLGTFEPKGKRPFLFFSPPRTKARKK